MVKAVTKKAFSLFLALIICASVVPQMSISVFAADGIEMRLERLKEEFPDGMYWNHYVSSSKESLDSVLEVRDESFADTVTSHPCTDHKSETGTGSYVCNYFDEGYQCHGFAARLFYRIFGVRQSTLQEVDRRRYEVKPGDLVRLRNNTHSGIVLSVSGLRFTVAECNITEIGGVPACEISWGRSCSLTDITYFVHAPNYEEVQKDTSWKSFDTKDNVGNGFYAAIINKKSEKALTVRSSDGNVILKSFTGAANQMWHFKKLSTGSYKITSCLDGRVLNTGSGAAANVSAASFDDSSKQKWAFYSNGSGYYISPDVSDSVLYVSDSKFSDGANIQTISKTKSSTQIFRLEKKAAPSASKLTATGKVKSVNLSWTKSANTSSYNLEIYRDGSLVKRYKKLTVNSGKVTLSAGNYSARIYSNNSFTSVAGNTVYFTVSDKDVLGKTAKVTATPSASSIKLSWTAVPGATGYRILVRSGDKWKTLVSTKKTTGTVKNLSAGTKNTYAIRAYSKSGTKVTWAPVYTEFTAATTPSAPSKVTVKQSTSSIKLTWPKVKNADGYSIYYKNSSGWVLHSSVTGTSKTLKELPAGKKYTLAVKAYINTSTGKVYGSYRSVKTATKPAAPKLSVGDIKMLSTKVTWKAVDRADGYQVYYKLDKDKSYTLLHDFDSGKRGVSVSDMTYNVYYTIAVRAYVKVGSSRVYGPYSEVRFRAVYL